MVLEQLEPKSVWTIFEKVFTQTPRESKKEQKIRAAVKTWVKSQEDMRKISTPIFEDSIGNLLIKIPASQGFEVLPPILLQGHMDMVCEANEYFNFANTPIKPYISDDNQWVGARGTTLGADNGIGVSIALALAYSSDPNFHHGPLEILLTVDEETGLTGAFNMDVQTLQIKSRFLINLDSEEIGKICIGSAGGGDLLFQRSFRREGLSSASQNCHIDNRFLKLTISGLRGGHSGGDIHLPRANANKLIARILATLAEKIQIGISTWTGGTKHNAITRESTVTFGVGVGQIDQAMSLLLQERDQLNSYYCSSPSPLEPEMKITWEVISPSTYIPFLDSAQIITTVNAIPSQALRFSPVMPGLVESSNNVAIITTTENSFSIQCSARSSVMDELHAFRRNMVQLGKGLGWQMTLHPAYPGWNPEPDKPFIQYVKRQYAQTLQKPIEFVAIHGGLETGVIGDKIPGIQMVSIGPNLESLHSPQERVNIESVGVIYQILKEILSNIGHI